MKRMWLWCLVGALCLGSAAWSQAQTGGTEKAVADLENQWLQSQKTNNPDLLAPLLADKFLSTTSEGKTESKTETLSRAKATKFESVDYEDLKVTVFGDAAIATGVFKGKETDASKKTIEQRERFTDTWVKMKSGKWQCVASHTSNIKAS